MSKIILDSIPELHTEKGSCPFMDGYRNCIITKLRKPANTVYIDGMKCRCIFHESGVEGFDFNECRYCTVIK